MKFDYTPPPPTMVKKRERRSHLNPPKRTEPNVEALLVPVKALSPEQARRKAEERGFALFGQRTWYLVEKAGAFRAVESLDDARGWTLVAEMKR
jgi:hypothetical protein